MANARTRTGGGREITTDGQTPMEAPFDAGGFPIRRVGQPSQPTDVARVIDATMIPDPPAALNADTDAASQVGNPIMEWGVLTADRKFDPRTATFSMAWTFWKSSAAAHKITIDVTTGGNQGWTTDAGLNTNFDIPNSSGATGQWLVRIDFPRKRVSVIPAS